MDLATSANGRLIPHTIDRQMIDRFLDPARTPQQLRRSVQQGRRTKYINLVRLHTLTDLRRRFQRSVTAYLRRNGPRHNLIHVLLLFAHAVLHCGCGLPYPLVITWAGFAHPHAADYPRGTAPVERQAMSPCASVMSWRFAQHPYLSSTFSASSSIAYVRSRTHAANVSVAVASGEKAMPIVA